MTTVDGGVGVGRGGCKFGELVCDVLCGRGFFVPPPPPAAELRFEPEPPLEEPEDGGAPAGPVNEDLGEAAADERIGLPPGELGTEPPPTEPLPPGARSFLRVMGVRPAGLLPEPGDPVGDPAAAACCCTTRL